LKSKDETVMGDVIRYLGGTGSSDARAVAALIEHYRTAKSDHQRWWALEALSYCGSNAKDAIPLCAEALKDGSPGLKQFAIRALLKLDPENKVLVSALIDLHAQEREWYRQGVYVPGQESLGERAIPELTAILANDKDARRRIRSAKILGS